MSGGENKKCGTTFMPWRRSYQTSNVVANRS
jgi:hypothetical protein